MTSKSHSSLRHLAVCLLIVSSAIATSAQQASTTTTAAATATPSTSAIAAAEAADTFDSRSTREQLNSILERHPREVGVMLRLDPTLFRNEAWISAYPVLRDFVAAHPEVPQNASYYLEHVYVPGDDAPEPAAVRATRQMMEGIQVFVVMITIRCPHEARLWEALASGQWPQACESELREHVAACRELALVATAITSDRHETERVASVPPSGAVWWRMQMRMEREAKQVAERTVRRAHSILVAMTVGTLLLVLAMTSLLRAGWMWLASALPEAGDVAAWLPATPPLSIVIVVSATLAVITPVALYLAVAEE